jgi:hypothetical protein
LLPKVGTRSHARADIEIHREQHNVTIDNSLALIQKLQVPPVTDTDFIVEPSAIAASTIARVTAPSTSFTFTTTASERCSNPAQQHPLQHGIRPVIINTMDTTTKNPTTTCTDLEWTHADPALAQSRAR